MYECEDKNSTDSRINEDEERKEMEKVGSTDESPLVIECIDRPCT